MHICHLNTPGIIAVDTLSDNKVDGEALLLMAMDPSVIKHLVPEIGLQLKLKVRLQKVHTTTPTATSDTPQQPKEDTAKTKSK